MQIPWWHPELGAEEAQRVVAVVESNFPNDGADTDEFAARIASLVGVAHGVGVSSGTAALYCALLACGVGPGDEVIVPDLTFVATANAVRATGADVVLVDVRLPDLSLDPVAVEAAVTGRTRAILPVHVNGRGGSIDEVVDIARARGLAVVEDACEALSSQRDGRTLGSFGDAACFSFAPTKIITTGQGGVVVTEDEALARRLRELKDQGRATRGTGGADEHPVFGLNFKLTNLNAAVGLAQLERLPGRLQHLVDLRRWYEEELSDLAAPALELVPVDAAGGERLAWIDVFVDERDALVGHLRERGIDSREFWHPVHSHPPYADPDRFPSATWASQHGLWLPSAFSLGREQVAQVGAAVREFAAARV